MSEDSHTNAQYIEGVHKFQGARSRAFWTDMLKLLRGQPTELLSFEEVRKRLRLREESYKGIQDIPLDQIKGSVGRYKDFTQEFLPKSNEMKERWSRVYAQATGMRGLPPIEVYKVGEVYFVRDGNHRVSVARQLGAKTIEAHVTELPTNVEFYPGMSRQEIDEATAYAAFLQESQLARTHHQSLKLSEPSRYAELLGHIFLHQKVLEQLRNQPVTTTEAANTWYDEVYRPAVSLIRKYQIRDLIGENRTEADVYLWMIDHLREVREQYGQETRTRKFSDALVDFLAERKIPIPRELLAEQDDNVPITNTQAIRIFRDISPDDEDTG